MLVFQTAGGWTMSCAAHLTSGEQKMAITKPKKNGAGHAANCRILLRPFWTSRQPIPLVTVFVLLRRWRSIMIAKTHSTWKICSGNWLPAPASRVPKRWTRRRQKKRTQRKMTRRHLTPQTR